MEIVKTYQFKKEECCKRCGRKLKKNDSKLLGYGPSCYKKVLKEQLCKVKERRLF
jgi:hypothetical protein